MAGGSERSEKLNFMSHERRKVVACSQFLSGSFVISAYSQALRIQFKFMQDKHEVLRAMKVLGIQAVKVSLRIRNNTTNANRFLNSDMTLQISFSCMFRLT